MPIFVARNGPLYFAEYEIAGPTSYVFIHGNLGGAVWWHPLLALLAAKPIGSSLSPIDHDSPARALVLEWRGSGRSGPPRAMADLELECIALEISELILARGRPMPPVLVGHSLGGMLALLAATELEQRIAGVFVINPLPLDGFDTSPRKQALLERMRRDPRVLREAMATTLNFSFPIQDELFTAIVEAAKATAPENWLWLPEVLRRFRGGSAAAALSRPALIFHGACDSIVTVESSRAWQAVIRKSKLIVDDRHGHSLNIEDPERLQALLNEFARSISVY